ncbi:MAG: hypothetical protein AB9919_05900 [Geobacteraceae bacterium]
MEAICKADYDQRVRSTEQAKQEQMLRKGDAKKVTIPAVGFNDIYGVWFFGKLADCVRRIALERFGVALDTKMHVYVNSEPSKIGDGIHEIQVYGHSCKLYKWMAQGYHRGLVVLADDIQGCAEALLYMESRTWSWQLPDTMKKK